MGPVLYLLYTAPLAEVIQSHGLDYHMYVDDNQLYFSFKTQEVDLAKSKIEECIASICNWMNLNDLKLIMIKLKSCYFILNSEHRRSFNICGSDLKAFLCLPQPEVWV